MQNTMEYRQLGQSGLTVSAIGLGCNNLGRAGTPTETQEGTNTVLRSAREAGINLFDIADIYGKTPGAAETRFGQALKYLGTQERENMVIVSKFGMNMNGAAGADYGARGSRAYIMRAVEHSLTRLGVDHLDVYIYHTPDGITPIDETLRALDTLIAQGKVRYIAHSNQAGWQIAQAEYVARELGCERFIAAENHYNLIDRRAELEVIPAARELQLGVLPYFPLANGLLTGKYRQHQQAPEGSRLSHSRKEYLRQAPWEQLEQFFTFARERELPEAQIALSWLLAQDTVSSVIAGATTPEQIHMNVQSTQVALNQSDIEELNHIFPAPPKIALF